MTGFIAVVLVFSIPIIAILTNHYQKQSKIKHEMIRDEIKLEQLKHENYLLETEKLRLELEKMNQTLSLREERTSAKDETKL